MLQANTYPETQHLVGRQGRLPGDGGQLAQEIVGKRPATVVTNRTYNRQVGGATMLIMTVQYRSARAGLPLISCSVTGTNLPSHRWRERHTLYPRLLDMP